MPAFVSVAWRRAVAELVRRGDLVPLVAAFEQAAVPSDVAYPHHLADLLRDLAAESRANLVWPIVAPLLAASASSSDWLLELLDRTELLDVVDPQVVGDWIGTDEQRAILIAGLVHPRQDELAPLARRIIQRFGSASAPAARVAERVRDGRTSAAWATDPDPEIRAWAVALHQAGNAAGSRRWPNLGA